MAEDMKSGLKFFIYILLTAVILFSPFASLKAKEESRKITGFDWGIGLSLPYYNLPIGDSNLLVSGMLGARINLFFDLRLNLAEIFSIGFESGLYFFPNIFNTTVLTLTSGAIIPSAFYLDLPIRVFVRLGSKNFYFHIFGGYYTGVFPIFNNLQNVYYYERGAEAGVRINLRGFFIEGSYILTNSVINNIDHFRVGLGYTNSIF
jgi:hypothetical protein